ncbi:hypothetical protein V8D89_013846 [Ganoderma adspersum]
MPELPAEPQVLFLSKFHAYVNQSATTWRAPDVGFKPSYHTSWCSSKLPVPSAPDPQPILAARGRRVPPRLSKPRENNSEVPQMPPPCPQAVYYHTKVVAGEALVPDPTHHPSNPVLLHGVLVSSTRRRAALAWLAATRALLIIGLPPSAPTPHPTLRLATAVPQRESNPPTSKPYTNGSSWSNRHVRKHPVPITILGAPLARSICQRIPALRRITRVPARPLMSTTNASGVDSYTNGTRDADTSRCGCTRPSNFTALHGVHLCHATFRIEFD